MVSRLCLLALPLLAGCAVPRPVSYVTAVDDLARHDVVFLGEEHDNTPGHKAQLALIVLLHTQRPELTVSMEMFERDVQESLDAYLAGTIDEAEFLQKARPWPNYARHYRPIVEYCKANHVPVVAANVPRSLAQKVAAEGIGAVAGNPHAAEQSTAPQDRYWDEFRAAMADHIGNDGAERTMQRFYVSQCLKDDTMAESIVRVLARHEHMLVVHLNGKFHSDHRLGTAARVLSRRPNTSIAVVSMEVEESADGPLLERGQDGNDFVLLVPPEPPKPVTKPTAPPAPEPGHPDPKEQATGQPSPHDRAAPEEAAPEGRPALGLMPDYDSTGGMLVTMVVPDGPAETAGLREGDRILQLDGQAIDDVRSYMSVLGSLRIGATIPVVVERDGKRLELRVQVGARQ